MHVACMKIPSKKLNQIPNHITAIKGYTVIYKNHMTETWDNIVKIESRKFVTHPTLDYVWMCSLSRRPLLLALGSNQKISSKNLTPKDEAGHAYKRPARLIDARRDTWWRHKPIFYKFVKKCDWLADWRTYKPI